MDYLCAKFGDVSASAVLSNGPGGPGPHKPQGGPQTADALIFTCVSYAEARNTYRLDVCLSVCLSVRHTLVLYQNG